MKKEILGIICLKENELKTFYVKYNYQNKGIGKELLAFLEKNNKIDLLKVYALLGTQKIYEKLGFEFEKKIFLETDLNNLKYESILMTKNLCLIN